MTVYVDDYRREAKVGNLQGRWSHLLADTSEERMEFARRLGLQPAWLQHAGTPLEHFDVVETVRSRAIRAGARPITYRQSGELVARKRAMLPAPAPVVEQQVLPLQPPSEEARKPLPRWNPDLRRHSWIKLRTHFARCGHCDLVAENEEVPGVGWVRWWHWPDGSTTADVATPVCPGPAE